MGNIFQDTAPQKLIFVNSNCILGQRNLKVFAVQSLVLVGNYITCSPKLNWIWRAETYKL